MKYLNKDILDKSFTINTKFVNELNSKKLKDFLDKKNNWNFIRMEL